LLCLGLFDTLPQRRLAAVLCRLQDRIPSNSKGHEEDTSMAFCNMCGAQVADGTTTCSVCAGRVATAPASTTTATAGGMTDNVAGMLAYVTIIPAIIFLVMEPYNKNRFIRFHSWQCLFFAGALFVLHIGLSIFAFVPFMALITLPLHLLVSVGGFIIWIVLLMKANQGQMYKLPVIGDIAEKQANAM
jgi:uncharacterized membrane protein